MITAAQLTQLARLAWSACRAQPERLRAASSSYYFLESCRQRFLYIDRSHPPLALAFLGDIAGHAVDESARLGSIEGIHSGSRDGCDDSADYAAGPRADL